jgi:hypothetical protein
MASQFLARPFAALRPTLPAQLGVDPWRAVDAAAGGEDRADMSAQLGLRRGPVLASCQCRVNLPEKCRTKNA